MANPAKQGQIEESSSAAMAQSVLTAPMATIGVPKEIKVDEQRVALTPDAVKELVTHGLEVRIQSGAGSGAGIDDEAFAAAGAQIVDQEQAWGAHLVVKVKEPQPEEFRFLRNDMVLFTYLHLAAYPEVGEALLAAGTTGVAYETVQLENGTLPLLAPMSEIAGRLAAQVGARLLERPQGGRGVLIGGCTGVQPARVVVLGAGTVGWNAARLAAAMDAEVMLLDRSPERLRSLEAYRSGRLMSVVSSAVGNMPGAVPFTSTEALVSVTLPYIVGIAGRGLEEAVTERPELLSGLNTVQGSVCHPGVAKALDVPPRHPMACLR